jgi:hypothetical protein
MGSAGSNQGLEKAPKLRRHGWAPQASSWLLGLADRGQAAVQFTALSPLRNDFRFEDCQAPQEKILRVPWPLRQSLMNDEPTAAQ